MTSFALFLVIMAVFLLVAAGKRKLTVGGCIAAAFVGMAIYAGTGFTGIWLIGTFFILAVLATQWGHSNKASIGVAETHGGKRNAGQVIANGGLAAVLACCSWLGMGNEHSLFLLMAAAISSATADTLSSELGTLYGKKYVNVIDFTAGKRGENGVVSLEGTLIGVAASSIVAMIVYFKAGSWTEMLLVVLAGTFGNLVDSFLGATLERRNLLSNNAVNFLNTLAAVLIAWILISLLS